MCVQEEDCAASTLAWHLWPMEVFSAPRAGNETLQWVSGKVWEVQVHAEALRICV